MKRSITRFCNLDRGPTRLQAPGQHVAIHRIIVDYQQSAAKTRGKLGDNAVLPFDRRRSTGDPDASAHEIEGIDHAQQVPAGSLDLLQIVHEIRVAQFLCVFLQHFTVTDDLVQRCLQVVTNVTRRRYRTGLVGPWLGHDGVRITIGPVRHG